MSINLLVETIEVLKRHNKIPADVIWCGNSVSWFSWKVFVELADISYDNGYGGNEIPMGLLVVGKDFWLERSEYDGSEWWVFKTYPQKPVLHRIPKSILEE